MAMGWVAAGTAVLNYMGQKSAQKAANRRANDANALAAANLATQAKELEKNREFQKEQYANLQKQRSIYRGMEFKNPYTDMQNPFEDLTVDLRAAEFQAQQGQQQRADVLSGLRTAAGGSGIAGLAQMLVNQQQQQTQQISVGIGQQERQNQMMAAKMANQLDMTERAGEASLQQMEMSRQATLLGIQMGQTAGANTAVQQSLMNQMSAGAAQANMMGQQASGLYDLSGQYGSNVTDTIGNYMTYKAGQ